MQENSDFFAIFSLEDARVASYSLEVRGRVYPNNIRQAPQNATSVFGDPAG